MRFSKIFSLLCCILIFSLSYGQEENRSGSFTAPLDIPMLLSGNFGELRSTHFHSGIDIKTQQQIGKNVYASKEGYVSRIKIQSGGYGNSIYIKHPDGYTTVYAHLNDFIPEIADYVKNIQYAHRKFETDIFPEKYRFPLAKGQIIGHSGNTGYSGGPHLHYEIRDANQRPLNVLRFNFNIRDNIPPQITNIAVYPVEDNSYINGRNRKVIYKPVRINGDYILTDTISICGKAGFGVETYDYLNGTGNRCTVYSIKLIVNGMVVYYHEMDKFSFSEVRYLNSHIDYEERMLNDLNIHRLFRDPNNKLSIYKKMVNNGIIEFSADSVYHIRVEIKDAYSNGTTLAFNAYGYKVNDAPVQKTSDSLYVKTFFYNDVNTYQTPEIKITLPEYVLYRNIDFKYAALSKDTLPYSDLHFIHSDLTPLCGSYKLSIKAKNLPQQLAKKAFIASVDRDNELNAYGGTWQNGFVTASVDCFGKFFILVDTIPPLIKPKAFIPNQHYTTDDHLTFEISDELSGLKSYNGYIDNEWALFAYDRKSDKLTYTVDKERLTGGKKHTLEIVVVDERNNISVYRSGFYY